MKKALKITAWLCLLMSLAAIVFGILGFRITNRSFFMGYALFGVVKSGGVMGFVGNLAIIVFTVVCYGLAGLNTLADRKRDALIWSAITSVLAIVSLIAALLGHKMTVGDIIVTAIPIAQTLLIVKSAD